MAKPRTPAFIIAALVLILIVVLLELGAVEFLSGPREAADRIGGLLEKARMSDQLDEEGKALADQRKPPGLGIRYLALVDGALLFTVGLIGLSLKQSARAHIARYQGAVTAAFAVILLGVSIGLIFVAIAKLTLMIALLLAFPFGTIFYLAVYGFFNVGGAAAVLGLLMTLKIACGASLLIGHHGFVPKTGLVLMVLTSLLAGVIVTFLHGLVPSFLASITDAIAAIVVAILAVVWLVALLIGSIPAIIAAVSATRASVTSKAMP
jgi:hypothetical protein